VARRVGIGFLLLIGLLVGLTLEPDSGTAASVGPPDVTGDIVGANHAKPLPTVTTVAEVARTTAASVLVVLLLLTQLRGVSFLRVTRDNDRQRSLLRSRVHARRGPPAPVLG
jgi:hypothetical protein